jgi:hypothetical protein
MAGRGQINKTSSDFYQNLKARYNSGSEGMDLDRVLAA